MKNQNNKIDISFNKLLTHTLTAPLFTSETIRRVHTLSSTPSINLAHYHNFDWRAHNKGGSFVKRWQKYVYKFYNKKLTPSQLTLIGNYVSNIAGPAKEYYFDFTRDLNWSSGDFGDEHSCFFALSCQSRRIFMNSGKVFAVRFFKKKKTMFDETHEYYKGLKGRARSWVYIHNDSSMLLFNAYGHTAKLQASVLASAFGFSLKKVSTCNGNFEGMGFYLNHEGNYIIGKPEVIKEINDVSIE